MSRWIRGRALVAAIATGCATVTPPALEPAPPAPMTTTTGAETTTTTGGFVTLPLPEERDPVDQGPIPEDGPAEQAARAEMVETQIVARGVSDPIVLEAMLTVPRHAFVPERYRERSYQDRPLPIGLGQTISQPYIVAWMSELLEVEPGDKVLEIGTGSGYQAAILAEMGVEVYTVEILADLAETASLRLAELGYDQVQVLNADGYFGWAENAPYQAIIVTAAPDHPPPPLLEQLAPEGRMVIPVGPVGSFQTMWRFTIDETGEPLAENLGYVSFVPLTRLGPDGVVEPIPGVPRG